jgi:HEAT repeat protein
MARECLRILESGDTEELFEIIPRIGVLRDPRFKEPLIALLSDKDLKKREFAAYALGSMGSREFFEPLKVAFRDAAKLKAFGAEEFLAAVIEAIGALGDDAAAAFFLPVLKKDSQLAGKSGGKLSNRIVESLGAIAQQGGKQSVEALVELTRHNDPEICAHAVSELSVAFWHRPNEISEAALQRIYELTHDRHAGTAESALSALQSLADVGCRRAEKFFTSESNK